MQNIRLKALYIFLLIISIIVLDLYTKSLVSSHNNTVILSSFIKLHTINNYGIAFSLFDSLQDAEEFVEVKHTEKHDNEIVDMMWDDHSLSLENYYGGYVHSSKGRDLRKLLRNKDFLYSALEIAERYDTLKQVKGATV